VRDDDEASPGRMVGADARDRSLEPREDLLVGLGPDQLPTLLLRK
jgi:hypothetical protein